MRFVDEFGRRIKAFRLTGRQHEKCFGIFALKRAEGDQRKRLLGRYDAAGNNDWRASTALRFRSKPIGDRRSGRKFEVILQVPADLHSGWRRTQSTNSLGVPFILHEKSRSIGERTA